MSKSRRIGIVLLTSLALLGVALAAIAHGPGMMGGDRDDNYRRDHHYQQGYPGMMGGNGGYGMMGPGMMGPGMMGGGYGMGHGMMMGGLNPRMLQGLDLSEDQREDIHEIMQQQFDAQWQHMRQMHDQMFQLQSSRPGEKIDVDAFMKAHNAMMQQGLATMRARLEAHNKMLDVLTDEQREQLGRYYR